MSFRASDRSAAGRDGEPIWRALLPSNVFYSAGFAPDDEASLTAAELASLGSVGEARRREFAAGRWHAKAALAKAGRAGADLPRTPGGAAAWPDGVVGSIAHGAIDDGVFAIAVVALTRDYDAVGVDLEPLRTIPPREWPQLLGADELAWVGALAVAHRSRAVLALWCAKEAAAKAALGAVADVRRLAVVPGRDDAGLDGDDAVRTFTMHGARTSGRMAVTARFAAAFCAAPANRARRPHPPRRA